MTQVSDDPEEHAMTFWEHLEELRSRLVKAILAGLIGSGVCWYYREKLLTWMTKPFVEAWNQETMGKAALHFPAPASLFIAYIKIAVMGGLVMALPVILYQLWAFIAPGLYSKEKRLAIPFVVASCGLFAGGGYFGWKLVFPLAFKYLLGFSGPVGNEGFEVQPTVMIDEYIEFVSRMLLAFGAAFELPVLIFFLSIAGVVNHIQLWKFFRYFVVVAFIVAAIITPPDVTSQILLAVPLIVLYLISIGVAWLVVRSKKQ